MSSDSSLVLEPLTVAVPQSEIDDLNTRLAMTRYPDQLEGQGWAYGAELSAVRSIVEYWRDGYDWRLAESAINHFDHFSTTIDGERIHFIHAPSNRGDAVPLLLTHGWPGSFVEFLDLIEPLRNPGPGLPAFHVVVPSLPGFGLSGPTVTTGVSPKRVAMMWVTLMAGLGYDRYLAQGGDWGSLITSWLGQLDPDHCAGIHINMITAALTDEVKAHPTPQEQVMLQQAMHFRTFEVGYHALQSTKPQSIGFSHADSPSGLVAWHLEKFTTWTDCDGDAFTAISRDRFLDNVSLYWFTNTAASAARIYYEHAMTDLLARADDVKVPTACALFPQEIYQASRRWAEGTYNVVHWTEFEKGGHFAAMEQPAELVADIRSFAQGLAA